MFCGSPIAPEDFANGLFGGQISSVRKNVLLLRTPKLSHDLMQDVGQFYSGANMADGGSTALHEANAALYNDSRRSSVQTKTDVTAIEFPDNFVLTNLFFNESEVASTEGTLFTRLTRKDLQMVDEADDGEMGQATQYSLFYVHWTLTNRAAERQRTVPNARQGRAGRLNQLFA